MPSASRETAYPSADIADVALRDGSILTIRPVRTDDRPAIREFLERLSPESIGFRFFGAANLDWVADWAVDVDYAERYALVATSEPNHRVIAHGAYVHTAADRAEVAFMVADAWQGHGIATLMLTQLAAVAQAHGIALFTAEVLPTNHRMIEVFRDSGFPVRQHRCDGVTHVQTLTSLRAQALAAAGTQ